MYRAQKIIDTRKAPSYAAQMAKHFADKIDVEVADDLIVFHFNAGTGRVEVGEAHLTLHVEAASQPQMQEVARILARHLERFAFREGLSIAWPDIL